MKEKKQKAGARRFGHPRTEEERRRRHQRLHGTSKLPPRGSGLRNKSYTRKVDRKMKDYGEIDEKKKVIRVNPKKGDLLNTVLHEEAHRIYPKLTEKQIRKKADKKETTMSIDQMVKILKKYRKR